MKYKLKNGICISTMKNPHYGCYLLIVNKETKGTTRGKQYKHIATVDSTLPQIIFINKHKIWLTKNEEYLLWLIIKVFSHEPIHHLLWRDGNDPHSSYDILRIKFKKQQRKILSKKSYDVMAGIF